ncbi:MAG: restriction endonuclease subunit S [Gemmatimonadales bacterium]
MTSRQFLRYWLEHIRKDIAQFSSTNTQENLNAAKVRNIPVFLPSLAEQRAIVAFLDRETARIDVLIANKERLVELLEEKRTALISQAVTRGLDVTVPMKESGVAWLGTIPSHWQVKRVKWVARMESGHTPDKKVAEYWEDGDIPWVSLNDTEYLRTHDYIESTAVATTAAGLANSSAHLLPVGTVVFSRDATIGRCGITANPMAVSQHFIGWACSEALLPQYLLYVFRSMTQELDRLTAGATLRTIGMPEVRTLVTPVPPRPEQQQIVSFVRDRSARLEKLVAEVKDAVAHMREYRTALITAAVTGRIDVRQETDAAKA